MYFLTNPHFLACHVWSAALCLSWCLLTLCIAYNVLLLKMDVLGTPSLFLFYFILIFTQR